MATGTWEGLGLPRLGEYEQEQQTAANDIVTLTGVESQTGNFVVVNLGASGAAEAVVEYNSDVGGVIDNFLQVGGSLAPTYLFSVGSTAPGIGAAADLGFFVASTTLNSTATVDCELEFAYVKVMSGSIQFNLLALANSNMS